VICRAFSTDVEGRGQKTEDRRQKTEDRRQKTEDRRQKTEDRRQKTEDRGQKTEDRRQKTEGRGRRTVDSIAYSVKREEIISYFKFQISNFKLYCLSTIGRTCAFESKIVVDSRFLIFVTRCEKRSKNFLQFYDFTFQLPADLIDFSSRITRRALTTKALPATRCRE